MSKLTLLTIAVVVLLVLNLGVAGFLFLQKPPLAQGGPRPFEHGPRNRIIAMLHFEKEQVEQYEELIRGHRASVRLLDERIRTVKTNLYQTLNEQESSVSDSLINELSELQKQVENVHYTHFLEIKRLCKPDQLAYFQELTGHLADFFAPKKQDPPLPRE